MVISVIKKLLLAILVAAVVGVSGLIWPFQDEQPEAVLKRLGARFSYGLDEKTVLGGWLEGSGFGDDEVTAVARIPSLQRLYLGETRITRRGVESLQALKGLFSLDLSRTRLTGEALDVVTNLSKLAELRLEGCHWLRDEHLSSLVSLRNLQRIDISGTEVTPTGLKHLLQLTALRHLNLDRCPALDDEAVETLIGLTKLEYLSLSGCQITSRGFIRLRRHLPRTRLFLPPDSMADLREVAQRGKFYVSREGAITAFECLRDADGRLQPLVAGDLGVIGTLPELSSLGLNDSNVTDEMLLELGSMPSLRDLWLRNTAVTDRGLQCLSGLPRLALLDITGTNLEGQGLTHLAATPQLQRLFVEARQGDELFEHLSSLQNLEDLSIQAPITDAGLNELSKLPRLRELGLRNTRVTCSGFKHLSKLPALTVLSLHGGAVDDSSIKAIAALTTLRLVYFRRTDVTSAATQQLLELRPDLDIRN